MSAHHRGNFLDEYDDLTKYIEDLEEVVIAARDAMAAVPDKIFAVALQMVRGSV